MSLFSPVNVGAIELSHRVVLPPLTRLRSGDLEAEYYHQRAQEPGTLLIAAAVAVDEPDFRNEKTIREWRLITDRVHSQKSFIFQQICAVGRNIDKQELKEVLKNGTNGSGIGLDDINVPKYVKIHVEAARSAVEAGFDGVEIHSAFGYVLDRFLATGNTRQDEYGGGSIESRAKFLLDVVDAVAAEIGPGKVGIRVCPQDSQIYGYITSELEKRRIAGEEIAYIHVVESRDSSSTPFDVRDSWNGILIRAGGHTPESARSISKKDDKALIAFGRLFISNPDLVQRLKKGYPLAPYDRDTFYEGSQDGKGYIDYPNYHDSEPRRNNKRHRPEAKKMILNAFAMTTPNHLAPGLWRHPRSDTANYNSLDYWTNLAKLLEKGKFHSLFLADTLGVYDVYKGPENPEPALAGGTQFPVNDPSLTISAMAAVTKSLGFGVTTSTTYEHPYSVARRFSSLDHLTNGRIIWNIVTSYLDSAAKLYGLDTQIEHDERYARAEEFLEVCYNLWESSWQDDAAVRDKKSGVFARVDKVRSISYEGKYFKAKGVHIAEPSPQRTPLLFQAGASKVGSQFGAKHSELVFISGFDVEKIRQASQKYRELARDNGRDPKSLKILASVAIIVAETDEKAHEKYAEYVSYADTEGALALFGGWTGIDLSQYSDSADFRSTGPKMLQSTVLSLEEDGSPLKWTKDEIAKRLIIGGFGAKIIGSPKTVADQLEHWLDDGDIDGFNLAHIISPGSFEDIIDYVIPELQERGRFHTEYENAKTIRGAIFGNDHLAGDHPGFKYKWTE